MRRILCLEHGKTKPTSPEDIARGLDARYRRGILTRSLLCDQCGCALPRGSEAVAMTQPSNSIGDWEHEYMITTGFAVRTPTGVFIIFDPRSVKIGLTYENSPAGKGTLHLLIDAAKQRHRGEIEGLTFICETDREVTPQLIEHVLYYSHPGLFAFVSYDTSEVHG